MRKGLGIVVGMVFWSGAVLAQGGAVFEPEKVETRPFRNQEVEKAANRPALHRAHGHSGHQHSGKSHQHSGKSHQHSGKSHQHAPARSTGRRANAHDHDHRGHSHDHGRPAAAARTGAGRVARDKHDHRGHAHGHEHARPSDHGHAHGEKHDHGVETEKIFGFTYGSSTEPAGTRKLALESVGRIGKRMSDYGALGQKIEFAYAFADRLTMSATVMGDYHRIKARPGFEADVEPVRARYVFNGFGGELRYRLLDRRTSPFGLTFHIEPSLAFTDEASGLRGRKFGSENKIILDRELVEGRLFGAINLTQEIEVVKERGAAAWERGTVLGGAMALSYQIFEGVFVGAEARYLRAYEGLGANRYLGDAVYAGPTLAVFRNDMFLSLAFNSQVAGRERAATARLDLANFERHQVRLKVGVHF